MNRLHLWLAVAALGLGTPAHAQAAATRPADPWPSSAVLTRLFALPSGRADGQRLISELRLTPAQIAELRRLARSEAQAAQAGRRVFGRDEATALNAKIARLSAEKDRKVRQSLGSKYSGFRVWVRGWWKGEVSAAR
ncbi:hypothetical protein [Deinococcus puniceus]|uniref:Periplasmic heavy metal sensor n=1 Tax=Deinococcus puniceus TaxID=1182568 RepID=A0A172T8Z0_9DEIO|nr:hypothetical protein [Deinococcus puniceus]ANE43422.1 hypothetical protein SU48_06180 [Deinococcus puniceus]